MRNQVRGSSSDPLVLGLIYDIWSETFYPAIAVLILISLSQLFVDIPRTVFVPLALYFAIAVFLSMLEQHGVVGSD